jgi:purine-nucleoside phosphorylase
MYSMLHFDEYWARAEEAAQFLRDRGIGPADVVIQCGSGMAPLAEQVVPGGQSVRMEEIPHFAMTTVKGHGNEAVLGKVGELNVLFFTGRIHLYEGFNALTVSFSTVVAKALGAKVFIVTSAAGGLNQHYHVGDLMIHTSFINFQGDNPLLHMEVSEYKQRFIDPKPPYDPYASRALSSYLSQADVDVRQGVYLGVKGPMFETMAELGMLRALGGDAVGMSSIPEIIMCHFIKLPVVGATIVSNECFREELVTHEKVLEISRKSVPALAQGIRAFLEDRYWWHKLDRRR